MRKYRQILKTQENDALLPRTRKELFKNIVKENFSMLVGLSLLQSLFSLLLAAAYVAEVLVLTMLREVNASTVGSVALYASLAALPCWGVRYTGRYAAYGVMKKRAHNESGYLTEVFFGYMKSGAGVAFALGLLVGTSALVCQVGSAYIIAFTSNAFARGLGIGVCILQFVLVFGAGEFFCSMHNFYTLRFKDCLKNSFSLCFASFPALLAYFAVCIGVPFAAALLSVWGLVAVFAVAAVWAEATLVTAATLYSHKLYDKFINSVHYAEYVNKGLYKEEVKDNG